MTGPIVVRRSGDFSLVFTDKDGNRQTASVGQGFPVLVDVLTDLLRDLIEEVHGVKVQLEILTEVEDITTRR